MTRRKPPSLPPARGLALPVLPPRRLTADLRQLRALAERQGPSLLAGQTAGEVGLVLAHPRSAWCPPEQAERGEVFARVMPLERKHPGRWARAPSAAVLPETTRGEAVKRGADGGGDADSWVGEATRPDSH